jgi:hypothetical protein
MPALTDPLGWFTLQFPEDWSQETQDCVTIFKTRHGIVYVSGGRHAGGKQQSFGGADFLARFLRSIGLAIEEDEVVGFVGPGCRIYYYRREADGSYWRYWSVTDDETALLISYTCDAEHAGKETDAVDGLVSSVRLFHSAPVH